MSYLGRFYIFVKYYLKFKLTYLTKKDYNLKLITMKHLKKVLLIVFAVVFVNNIYAQDEDNRWIIELGTNVVDFYPTGADVGDDGLVPTPYNSDEGSATGDFGADFFNTDHWNTGGVVSSLRVGYYAGSGFSVGLTGSFNSITQVGDISIGKVLYIAGDLDIKWSFIRDSWFDPYILAGGGYTWLEKNDGGGTANVGLGMAFWFNNWLGANVQTKYKHSFDEDALLPHFQHNLGIVFKFGGIDTDGDGIYDKNDACPEVAGLEAFNGCPDTDGDGIQDSEDACPTEAGLAEFNGCPDSDGDGVPDKDDACPTEAGLVELNGCPDRDGDGVADKDDKCPDVAGPAANSGCPWPDADGDGVFDKDDECPNIAGPASNNGCPTVSVEVQKEITDLARAIYFVTGSSKFTDETEIRLEQISAIVNQYKTMKFDVEGHTDSTGSDKINNKLSQSRADAVRAYLVDQGFPGDMMVAKGFGSANPIGDNKTSKGRQQNRRVEIFSEDAER